MIASSPHYINFQISIVAQKPRIRIPLIIEFPRNHPFATETFLHFPPSSFLIELIYPFSTAKHAITNFLCLSLSLPLFLSLSFSFALESGQGRDTFTPPLLARARHGD